HIAEPGLSDNAAYVRFSAADAMSTKIAAATRSLKPQGGGGAARVRAGAAAETLIDNVSGEGWNHDALRDNCNVFEKDDLINTGEPVAYRWRYRNSITNTWSNWIDGKGPEKPNPDDEIEEQALYTHPAPQPSGTVKPLDEEDY